MKSKNLKPIFLSAIIIALFSIVMIGGCKKETTTTATCTDGVKNGTETGVDCGGSCSACFTPCDTVICQNGGTCSNGSCNCPVGWSGIHCEINTDAKQHNEDIFNIQNESELNITDINNIVMSVSGFGGGSTVASVCGAVIDSSQQYAATPTVIVTFDGVTHCGSPARTRSGQVKIELIHGAKWSDAGAVLRVTNTDYKITFLNLNNHFVTFNGTKYLSDLDGFDLFNYFVTGSLNIRIRERSYDMTTTFENGTNSSWNSARLTTWAATNYSSIIATVNGDTLISGKTIDSWGSTRFGTNFKTEMVTPWKSGTNCGWGRATQGKYVSVTDNFTTTTTLGLDSGGNPASGCGGYFKLEWLINAGSISGNILTPY